jgi:UTP pyrophosphatase
MHYITHYPTHIQEKVLRMLSEKTLGKYLLKKYPQKHSLTTDRALYEYVMDVKNEYLKKYRLDKVFYDGKVSDVSKALGTHTFISRVQGEKLKSKNVIKIATLFKQVPEDFLRMIVIHELAHFKQKEHNKAFYQFCEYMMQEYHQIEFDTRLYLLHVEKLGKLYN